MPDLENITIRRFDEFIVTNGHYGKSLFSSKNYVDIVDYCINLSEANPEDTLTVRDESCPGIIKIQDGAIEKIESEFKVNKEHLLNKWFIGETKIRFN